MSAPTERIDPDELVAIEQTAVELARLAGVEIQNALGRQLTIRYKTGADETASLRDPVSEVDQRAEMLIRDRLEELFPDHGILGEEMDVKPGRSDFLWAVDPIDGTTNFVNGFPLFAAAIGVVHRGVPVVGAVWCSASHALRPGVYHARRGGAFSFEGETLHPRADPAVRRRLAGEPHAPVDPDGVWDVRKTGSAAIECAYVAAGLLAVARFERPNIWDVAGGIALVEAAGFAVHVGGPDGWAPFTSFEAAPGQPSFHAWRRPLVVGEAEAAQRMVERLG